jgi:hypothetical protein
MLWTCGTVAAQEVENPEYTSWAKVKKGTSIVMTHTGYVNGRVSYKDIFTYKLVDVKDDHVVLEVTPVHVRDNGTTKGKPAKTTVKKLFVPAAGAGKDGITRLKPAGTASELEETIKIGKAEYKTTRYAANNLDAFREPQELTLWLSPDVPGCVVKKEVKRVGEKPSHFVVEFAWGKKP